MSECRSSVTRLATWGAGAHGQLGHGDTADRPSPCSLLLMEEDVLSKVWLLRKVLGPLNSIDSMEFLLDKFKKTKNNGEFLDAMNS